MTELQKTEFEMLRLFVGICEKYDLNYYLVCGSALGAVKYGGFIPWDDDIDVALPRPDYEHFLKIAKDELPEWCFVQNYITDPQFHLLGTKLRDSRTTYIENMTDTLSINHGVFIDVFPLDGLPGDMSEYKRRRKCFDSKRRVRLNYNRFSRETIFDFRTNICFSLHRLFGKFSDTAQAIKSFDKYIASFDADSSEVWCNHANSASSSEFAPRSQYGSGVLVSFEGLTVRIPENYDEYLTQKYGDWREDIPEEEKHGHHLTAVCDLHRSYTDYC